MTSEPTSSLRRALRLLDALATDEAVAGDGWGVARLAEHLGRDQSQVSRTMRVLLDAGFVERDPDSLAYRLGWRLFALAARAGNQRLIAAGGPLLRRLVDRDLGERVHLSVLHGSQVLTLLTQSSPHTVQSVAWAGRLVPVWSTSSGRALLIDHELDELERMLEREPFSGGGPNAPRTVAELHERIVASRARGYAIVDEEFEPGLVAASAPVRDFSGRVVAALNVSAPRFRFWPRLEEAGEALRAAAGELSAAMGHAAVDRARVAALPAEAVPSLAAAVSGFVAEPEIAG